MAVNIWNNINQIPYRAFNVKTNVTHTHTHEHSSSTLKFIYFQMREKSNYLQSIYILVYPIYWNVSQFSKFVQSCKILSAKIDIGKYAFLNCWHQLTKWKMYFFPFIKLWAFYLHPFILASHQRYAWSAAINSSAKQFFSLSFSFFLSSSIVECIAGNTFHPDGMS